MLLFQEVGGEIQMFDLLIFYALSMQHQVRKSVARTALVWVELNRRGNEALRRVSPPSSPSPSLFSFHLTILLQKFKTSRNSGECAVPRFLNVPASLQSIFE